MRFFTGWVQAMDQGRRPGATRVTAVTRSTTGLGSPGQEMPKQALDQLDVGDEEQQGDEEADVPDPAHHHVEGRALEGARVRRGCG